MSFISSQYCFGTVFPKIYGGSTAGMITQILAMDINEDKQILIGGWTEDSLLADSAVSGAGKAFIAILADNVHLWMKSVDNLDHIRAVTFGPSLSTNIIAMFDEGLTLTKTVFVYLSKTDGSLQKVFSVNTGVPHNLVNNIGF